MKTEPEIIKPASVIALAIIILMCCIGTLVIVKKSSSSETINSSELLLSNNILTNQPNKVELETTNKLDDTTVTTTNEEKTVEVTNSQIGNNTIETKIDENKVEEVDEEIVYDGLTKSELVDKLNRNLNSTLSNKGDLFANLSLQYGIDPYLAVAIVLHETGCSWDCSDLVKYCNNVGGQKGSPGCGGGSYLAFSTLDEGIEGFMSNLYDNFYAKGLTTPETINPKYAASQTWASSINNYINKIKAS